MNGEKRDDSAAGAPEAARWPVSLPNRGNKDALSR